MGFRHPAVWVALILLIVVLFGASKLPDITRNLGKSMKIFKEEVRDLRDDVDVTPQAPAQPTIVPPTTTGAAPTPPAHTEPAQTEGAQTQPVDPPQAPHPSTDQQ